MRIRREFVKELFEKLRGVRTITINGWCLQALSVLEMEEAPSLLSKYILLTGDRCLKLELDEETKERFNFDEEEFLCSRKGSFQLVAEHLKRVEIACSEAHSSGSKYLHALIKFILGDIPLYWRR
ncbi:hypothetical protein NL676_032979 [Syzygium grande]|nr:hypothetical protein NL676_032979 [Syzygium grande]